MLPVCHEVENFHDLFVQCAAIKHVFCSAILRCRHELLADDWYELQLLEAHVSLHRLKFVNNLNPSQNFLPRYPASPTLLAFFLLNDPEKYMVHVRFCA